MSEAPKDQTAEAAAAKASGEQSEGAQAAPEKKPDDNMGWAKQLLDIMEKIPVFASMVGVFKGIMGMFSPEEKKDLVVESTAPKAAQKKAGTLAEGESEEKTAGVDLDSPVVVSSDLNTAAPEPEEKDGAAKDDSGKKAEPEAQAAAPAKIVLTDEQKADMVYDALLERYDGNKNQLLDTPELQAMAKAEGLGADLKTRIEELMESHVGWGGFVDEGEVTRPEFRKIAEVLEAEGKVSEIVEQLEAQGIMSAADAALITGSTTATVAGTEQAAAERGAS